MLLARAGQTDGRSDGDDRDVIAAAVPTTTWYLSCGRAVRRSAPSACSCGATRWCMFMCVELMLNAVNLSFVALAKQLGDIGGQTTVFFVLVVAAAEVVVGLGIIVADPAPQARTPPPTTSRN